MGLWHADPVPRVQRVTAKSAILINIYHIQNRQESTFANPIPVIQEQNATTYQVNQPELTTNSKQQLPAYNDHQFGVAFWIFIT